MNGEEAGQPASFHVRTARRDANRQPLIAMLPQPLDLLVLGGGLHGLTTALAARQQGARVIVIEREPNPGGMTRTQRSEGFACELGPFALAANELIPILAVLPAPPPLIGLQVTTGATLAGTTLTPTEVEGDPRSGRSGLEDLVTALRRELGPDLRLGRAATGITPMTNLWTTHLAGEIVSQIEAAAIHLCVPLADAAALLMPLDPALPLLVRRLVKEQRAFVFLGTWQDPAFAQSCQGYGVITTDPESPVAEILFCSNAFAGRAVTGKALVRVELQGNLAHDPDPDVVAALAEAELRRITGWSGRVLFRRVHPFTVPVINAAHVECRVRISELCRRAKGLSVG
ncbi:hypothetical protein LBMAG49_30440 [Planctomycetota bacterium]|nr:hypothetical protein LBMAG49_30440 [Planctomycetota bacterium]